MVHELSVQAVKIKLTIFDPARKADQPQRARKRDRRRVCGRRAPLPCRLT